MCVGVTGDHGTERRGRAGGDLWAQLCGRVPRSRDGSATFLRLRASPPRRCPRSLLSGASSGTSPRSGHLGLALLVSPALAGVPSADAAGNGWSVAAAARFSPNGDDVKDTLSIRYRLPVGGHPRLTISPASDRRRPIRRVDLGNQPAGTHTWTWNGRNESGKQVVDKSYVIRIYDVEPTTWQLQRASKKVQVDTTLRPELTAPTYGAEPGAPAGSTAHHRRHRHPRPSCECL